jgi:hypothetical protein
VSIDMPEVFVVAELEGTATQALPGSWIVRISELVKSGAEPAFVRMLNLAADRLFVEEFAVKISSAVDTAMAKSVAYVLDGFTIENGRAGWSEDLRAESVGVLSSAQGVLALSHAGVRSEYIESAVRCLESAQNDDGGWRIRHALAGRPTSASITESTCYCLMALVESGRSVDGLAVAQGIGWLLDSQLPDGGWGSSEHVGHSQVVATALAVRTLARLGFPRAALRGADWLQMAQHENGGWSFVRSIDRGTVRLSVAPSAHSIISLLKVVP